MAVFRTRRGIISRNILKPLTAFHLFPKLAPEIRWMIWKIAICNDDAPRIHYYSLFNSDDKGHRRSSLQKMMLDYPPEPKKPYRRWDDGRLRFIYPPILHSQPSECSWAEANRFNYFWDAGLQNSCKESRAIMLKHQLLSSSDRNLVTLSHGGQYVYLKIPNRDIICFRFSPEDLEACVSLKWDILITRLPFFHLPQAPDINLALDFHDSWDDGFDISRESMLKCLQEPSNRGLAMRAHYAWSKGELPGWARIWLIDRGEQLPTGKVSRHHDNRYRWRLESSYGPSPLTPKQKSHTFIDGKNKYVESYMREGQEHPFSHRNRNRDVPVLSFIWKARHLCRPTRRKRQAYAARPSEYTEHFFKVLRQLPGTNGTGCN